MTSAITTSRGARGPWLAGLVLLLAVLVGGLGGVVLDRKVLLPRMAQHPSSDPGPGPRPRHGEFRSRFAREVGLTAEQKQRVDSIMEQQGRELRAVRRRVQPKLDSIISSTRRALDSVLTPEQRQKAEAIRRRHPRHPRPEGGGIAPSDEPPGAPPPPPPSAPPR
jgi:hypothetical protein